MATEQFANFAQTTLNGSITAGATSLVVNSVTNFPTVPQFRIAIDQEIFLVTGLSGTTFTVIPGYENTTQANHSNGAAVAQVLTAGIETFLYTSATNLLADNNLGGVSSARNALSASTYLTFFDTTLTRPFFSDGYVWRDNNGNLQIGR